LRFQFRDPVFCDIVGLGDFCRVSFPLLQPSAECIQLGTIRSEHVFQGPDKMHARILAKLYRGPHVVASFTGVRVFEMLQMRQKSFFIEIHKSPQPTYRSKNPFAL
jgi:hypothetical protein